VKGNDEFERKMEREAFFFSLAFLLVINCWLSKVRYHCW